MPEDGPEPLAKKALLLGLVPVVGVVAIPFGFVARRRATRELRPGGGSALVGIALGALWVCVLAAVLLANSFVHAQRGAAGTVTRTEEVSFSDVRVGDCVLAGLTHVTQGMTMAESVAETPCANPHDGEVTSYSQLQGSSYPPDIEKVAGALCSSLLRSYATQSGLTSSFYYPLRLKWAAGDHRILCIAESADGSQLTGSVRAR